MAAKKKPAYELFDKHTQSFIYNMQRNAVQRMLDFDYVAGRDTPSVAAIINPTGKDGLQKFYFGPKEILLPVFRVMKDAAKKHKNVDVLISFASYRSAPQSVEEAFDIPQLKTIIIIAEGIPERRMKEINVKAKKLDRVIIGPATVGGIQAGAFKIANTAGTIENIKMSKLHRPGSVGFVSKSGGLSNEAYNIISRNSDGLYEGVAIGGDRYPGSSLMDHVMRYEKNPKVKMIVCLGEVGGTDEYNIVDALKAKKITKPLVVWVTGTCAKAFKTDVQFGHAGAKADVDAETADAKNKALRDAGAHVPTSFDDYPKMINKVYKSLVKSGKLKPKPEVEAPSIPEDYAKAVKTGMIRKPASFINTISDETGEELYYGKYSITEVFKKDFGMGGVVSVLWFKKLLPKYATDFIEMCLMVTADHGPAVSGAHNTIVATRAGKDLISSLVSGMLCIGPRFGGALDGAAEMFSMGVDKGMTPEEFVVYWKKKSINIQGIGHRVKSIHNPDARVTIVKNYVEKNFKKHPIYDFSLEVEKVTTAKRDNLILNVDGIIGIAFADMLRTEFPKNVADDYIHMGALNALFVLGRSFGFVGHHLDQKRLKQGLYRHPWDDIAYMTANRK